MDTKKVGNEYNKGNIPDSIYLQLSKEKVKFVFDYKWASVRLKASVLPKVNWVRCTSFHAALHSFKLAREDNNVHLYMKVCV